MSTVVTSTPTYLVDDLLALFVKVDHALLVAHVGLDSDNLSSITGLLGRRVDLLRCRVDLFNASSADHDLISARSLSLLTHLGTIDCQSGCHALPRSA